MGGYFQRFKVVFGIQAITGYAFTGILIIIISHQIKLLVIYSLGGRRTQTR